MGAKPIREKREKNNRKTKKDYGEKLILYIKKLVDNQKPKSRARQISNDNKLTVSSGRAKSRILKYPS